MRKKKEEIENALFQKVAAINLLDYIRSTKISKQDYRILRDALESMAAILEDELNLIQANEEE